jgi:Na+(H+)/acetate symporter ActP
LLQEFVQEWLPLLSQALILGLFWNRIHELGRMLLLSGIPVTLILISTGHLPSTRIKTIPGYPELHPKAAKRILQATRRTLSYMAWALAASYIFAALAPMPPRKDETPNFVWALIACPTLALLAGHRTLRDCQRKLVS